MSKIISWGKRCSRCRDVKALDKFPKGQSGKGKYCYCKECHNAINREYYKRKGKSQVRREIERSQVLYQKYSITPDEYQMLYMKQKGLCAACGMPETRTDKRSGGVMMLAVDHCHTLGCVRGLLCHECNVALGLLHDNSERMHDLVLYIQRYKEAIDRLM